MDWNFVFYFSITITSLLLCAVGWWLTTVMPGIDRWNRRFFKGYFTAIVACCLALVLEYFSWQYSVPTPAVFLLLVLECLLISALPIMLTAYLLHGVSEDLREGRLMHTTLVLWATYVVLVTGGPHIGVFAYVGDQNHYFRGPLYPLLMVPLIAMLLLDFVCAIRRRAQLPQKVSHGLSIALVTMIVTLVANMFTDAVPLFDASITLSAIIMYGLALSDQIERDLNYQRQIASQRANIMVLQMRPHFVYNTLTAIYCLCDQDPQMAKDVVMDFTAYLRRNFDAVASDEPVPFSVELEHTRSYLAVEQAQYEDSLLVEYDTPHTMFRLPPLTLQPIVENAVKHGRDPYAGPLHIFVRTRKTDAASEVVVTDDGCGFKATDNGQGHAALDNIRQRLEMMCSGSLTIAPNEGGGTVVTVTIPYRPTQ